MLQFFAWGLVDRKKEGNVNAEHRKKQRKKYNTEIKLGKSFKFNGTIYEMIDIAIKDMRWNSFPMIIANIEADEAKKYSDYWHQKMASR